MSVETEAQKREYQRWSRFAIQLLGASDSGHFEHLTTDVVIREAQSGELFARLERELASEVWEISKLTDVDRHKLWRSSSRTCFI